MGTLRYCLLILTLARGTKMVLSQNEPLNMKKFPDDFMFGIATASYQVEGAWNESDKTEHIWDYLVHNYPEMVADGSTGDVAADTYHHIDDDVALIKNMGMDFYRFSLSWTRILPTGYANYISQDGVAYYNKLIDALVENDIIPLVTIFHWDLPQNLQGLGGWANPYMVDYFTDFAEVCFQQFGDRVKWWTTFNEPFVFCSRYGAATDAPVGVNEDGIGDYMCQKTVLLSHAKAYHLYNDTYRTTQNGSVGIVLSTAYFEPNSTSEADKQAAERIMQLQMGVYAHPIFSEEGGYSQVAKEAVATRSTREGFPYSRMEDLTDEEAAYIKGTSDYLGVNHYCSYKAVDVVEAPIETPAATADMKVYVWFESDWEGSASSWIAVGNYCTMSCA